MFINKCPVGCESELVDSNITLPECTLKQCPVCGQLLSNATEELYQQTMKRFDNAHQMDTNPRIHIKRLKRVMHYWKRPPKETRVLDVGCSFGMSLRQLTEAGFMAEGVEPSLKAAQKCRADGFTVHCAFLQDVAMPENSVDIITMYEVVEHLKDPRQLIKECHRILKPGGMLFISTGNTDSFSVRALQGRWDYFSMQDGGQGHISFFNPASLSKLARSIGFHVAGIETRRVSLVNRKYHTGLRYSLGKLAQEILNPVAKVLNKGHDMLVILQK